MEVKQIDKKRPTRMLEDHHYAHVLYGQALPQTMFAFGLFDDEKLLVGAVLYARPASYTLCRGVCGIEHSKNVIELARLVVTTHAANAASLLIGRSLRMLPEKPWIVVSYADCNEGHVGYVYQATNWLYTGQGSAEPKWRHPTTGALVSKTRRHIDRKAAALGLCWKELIRERQEGKHRYVCFVGTKREKDCYRKCLRYPVMPYPKGKTARFSFFQQRNLFDGKQDG